jgi:hypothetical protein
MRALIHLTASEGKKLIGRGTIQTKPIKEALREGLVVLHPSSTTYFIYEEITGTKPAGVWVCGVIVGRGMCVSKELEQVVAKRPPGFDQVDFMHSWVFDRGELRVKVPLGKILEQMGEDDVYIKTPNVIDPQGNVGVFHANPDGGTISRVLKAQKIKGFHLVMPISLLKSIPTSINTASSELGVGRIDISMGIPVGLMPLKGEVITEVNAIEILSGAAATNVACGGMNEAEGNTSYVINGERRNVEHMLSIIKGIKGTKAPTLNVPECEDCSWKSCQFRGKSHPSL